MKYDEFVKKIESEETKMRGKCFVPNKYESDDDEKNKKLKEMVMRNDAICIYNHYGPDIYATRNIVKAWIEILGLKPLEEGEEP